MGPSSYGRGFGQRFVKGKGRGKGRGRLGVIRNVGDWYGNPGRFNRFKGASRFLGRGRGKGKGQQPSAITNGEAPTKVFFANVPYTMKTWELREIFQEVGDVERVFVFDDYQGNPRGMGLVTYSSARGANAALEKLNGRWVGDRELYLQEDTAQYDAVPAGRSMRPQLIAGGDTGHGVGGAPRGRFSSYKRGASDDGAVRPAYTIGRTVFFANVLFDTPATTLIRHFEKVGLLSKFTLFTLPDGRSRGMGICEFRTFEGAEAAYHELHGTRVDGRPLLVDHYTPLT